MNEGISNVLNVAYETYNINYTSEINVMKIPLIDHPSENISKELEVGYAYISLAKESNKKILVHCVAGISRSTTFVLYYLMKDHKMTLSEALDFIRGKRPQVRPNDGFLSCLYNFQNIPKNEEPVIKNQWCSLM